MIVKTKRYVAWCDDTDYVFELPADLTPEEVAKAADEIVQDIIACNVDAGWNLVDDEP